MKVQLEMLSQNIWQVVGENGYMDCKIEKDGYNTWFVPMSSESSFSADELEAIIKAMRSV